MAYILDDRADCAHGVPFAERCYACRPVTSAQPAQTGWKCPGCGRCWSPSVLACHHCPEAKDPEPTVDMFRPFARVSLHVPDLLAEGGLRILRATDEWDDIIPGFQCRLRSAGEQFLEFRLTPADGSP